MERIGESNLSENEQVAHALWALAEQCMQAHKIIPAIRFLESILQQSSKRDAFDITNDGSSTSILQFTPHILVRTRLRIAEILLAYTENIEEANQHLNKALVLCTEVSSLADVQLRILYYLIQVHHSKGAVNLEKQTILKGLNLLSKYTDVKNSTNWFQYFHLSMASALRREESINYKEILQYLQTGLLSAESNGNFENKFLFMISHSICFSATFRT